jgi:cobalt-zinc-cadmium efflux system outer membrane protein
LAWADGVPDVTAGAGARFFPDAGEQAAVVELSAPLPVFDRNQGRVLEARYMLGRAVAQQRAAEADIERELAAAHADAASAAFALRTLRDQTLPAARAAFEAAKEAFANGRTDFLDVLDAERTLVEVERQLIDARQTQQSAAATLEGLIAAPLGE